MSPNLKTDLQVLHDALRCILGAFSHGSHVGDRVVRTAQIDQEYVYGLLDKLTEIRKTHNLEDKS